MANDDGRDLSRRKLLGSVATVGAAGAIGGTGTMAFFADEEEFANNQLVAGELDLKVDWEQTYNGEPVNAFPDEDGDDIQDDIETRAELADEAGLPIDSPSVETMFRDQFADVPDDRARPLIELDDLKPGDTGEVTFSLHLFDNPGYVWMYGRCENEENGLTEPEADAPGEGPGGELGQAIRATLWYEDDDSTAQGDDGDSTAQGDRRVVFEGSLGDLQILLCDGIPLDGDRSTTFGHVVRSAEGAPLYPADGAAEARECFANSTTHRIGISWELPRDVGNEIQTDSNVFDVGFYTEQCRHSDGRTNERPFVTFGCNNPVTGWCQYEIVAVAGTDCPWWAELGNVICTACHGEASCDLEKGETTGWRVNSDCLLEVRSLHTNCQERCDPDPDGDGENEVRKATNHEPF